ncbi:MAG: hypothetical protein H0T79_18670 [Deltaproteobacteria bacterium]|nr:hypothetical protein [Deltaproteobacteria bacterium]
MRTILTTAILLTFAGSALAETPKPPPPPTPTPTPTPTPRPTSATGTTGTDYASQAKILYRVAACGGQDEVPERFSKPVILSHCKEMSRIYASYKKAWADQAKRFIGDLRPADAPKTVVYPFGGGDLVSALVVYPDATELTTISLEAAGDARTIDTISKSKLSSDVSEIGLEIHRLYHAAHSTTKSLQNASHSTIPGTIMFALAALVVHDMEPLALRYFDIEANGTLRYLSNEELDTRLAEYAATKRGKSPPKKITHYWYEQDNTPFANVEIQYRPRSDAKAAARTYRHIVANLDDPHMDKDDRVLKHLALKGKVSVMTKAASFLLWYDDFSKIRNYLLQNVAWMISDASGIPPSYAEPAGFEQITYGEFTGPYFIIDSKNTRREFVKLWKNQPKRALPFRFGYPDDAKHNHLMITRPKAK